MANPSTTNPSGAAYASSAPGTVSYTYPVANAGDLVFVCYTASTSTGTPSISDVPATGSPNTWIPLYGYSGVYVWYCVANNSGNTTISVAQSPSGGGKVMLIYDVQNGVSVVSTSTTGSTGVASAQLNGQASPATFVIGLDGNPNWTMVLMYIAGSTGSTQGLFLSFIVAWNNFLMPNSPYEGWDTSQEDSIGGARMAGTLATSDVVTDICVRAGLLPSQIDVSLLTNANIQPNVTVQGYLIEQPRSAAEILKTLTQAYYFDGCESNGMMRWIPRGMAPAISIPESDLGLLSDKAMLEESLAQAQDLPQQMTVIHDDPVLDFQANRQLVVRSTQVAGSTLQNVSLRIPMTMDQDFAMQVAEKALYLAWLERSTYKFNLWRALYMLLDPTDVIEFEYEGLTFTARITENTIGQGYVIEIQCAYENSGAYTSKRKGGTLTGVGSLPAFLIGPTQLYLFDINLLEDSDSNPAGTGFYFGFGSQSPDWQGAVLYDSSDDSDFSYVTGGSPAVTYGYATTTLGAPASPWIWDEANTLTVNLVLGSFSGDTQLDVLNGSNLMVVGGEIIAFENAVQNSDGTWTISNLLRGLRGTEWACGTHGANELAILVSSGLTRQDEALNVLGVPEYYEAITAGQDASTAGSQEFIIGGADLKPYAPVGIGGTVDGSGNITVTWIRRTRIGGEADWADGVTDVPLSEDEELYDVDILNGSTVVRTISGLTSATCFYSAADQTADFGSVQSQVTANVYQVSGEVGRGYKGSGVAPTPGDWPVPWPAIAGSSTSGVGSFYVNGS